MTTLLVITSKMATLPSNHPTNAAGVLYYLIYLLNTGVQISFINFVECSFIILQECTNMRIPDGLLYKRSFEVAASIIPVFSDGYPE